MGICLPQSTLNSKQLLYDLPKGHKKILSVIDQLTRWAEMSHIKDASMSIVIF